MSEIDPYPEHAKRSHVIEEMKAVEEFINTAGYVLAKYDDGSLQPTHEAVAGIVAKHFDIDLWKIEAEQRAMVRAAREINEYFKRG